MPLVIAGAIAGAANVLSTVLVAHLISAPSYGELIQLLSLFLVISMPGTALLVGVVRRVTALDAGGHSDLVRKWVRDDAP